MTRHFNVLLITCALLLCARAESRVPEYVIVDVGPGDELAGINERQDLLVSFQGADAPHTGIYHRNGKFTDISLLPGMGANCGFSYLPGPYLIGGGGINDRGEAVVTIYFDDEVHDVQGTCVATYSHGALQYQYTFGRDGRATGINRAGQIVGYASYSQGFGPGCDFEHAGQNLRADGINNKGQIIASGASGEYSALCTNGIWKNIVGLGGPFSAVALNDRGDVVGQSLLAVDGSDAQHPFLYKNGQSVDLGALPGQVFGSASDINRAGQIVGQSLSSDSLRLFLYMDGKIHDLQTLIRVRDPLRPFLQLGPTIKINDRGIIAVIGFDPRVKYSHVYLLKPIDIAIDDKIEDLVDLIDHAFAGKYPRFNPRLAALYSEHFSRYEKCFALAHIARLARAVGPQNPLKSDAVAIGSAANELLDLLDCRNYH